MKCKILLHFMYCVSYPKLLSTYCLNDTKPSWSFEFIQLVKKFPVLWISKLQCRVYRSVSFISNSVIWIPLLILHFLWSISLLSSYLCLDLASKLFTSGVCISIYLYIYIYIYIYIYVCVCVCVCVWGDVCLYGFHTSTLRAKHITLLEFITTEL
jgi:hypothetical protein